MSNLGMYQLMTTLAKKVGGPMVLVAATAVSGWAVGRSVEAAGKKVTKVVRDTLKRSGTPCETKGQLFKVVTDGVDSGGLTLRAGDEYRVLECDGASILIEVLNHPNNPYFVSSEFLRTVSDFPAEDAAEGE